MTIPGDIIIKARKIEGYWVVSARALDSEYTVGYRIDEKDLVEEFPHAVRTCVEMLLANP